MIGLLCMAYPHGRREYHCMIVFTISLSGDFSVIPHSRQNTK